MTANIKGSVIVEWIVDGEECEQVVDGSEFELEESGVRKIDGEKLIWQLFKASIEHPDNPDIHARLVLNTLFDADRNLINREEVALDDEGIQNDDEDAKEVSATVSHDELDISYDEDDDDTIDDMNDY